MKQNEYALRIVRKGTLALKANAKTVFPLLCPVKEADWIAGWEDICTLFYTDSGVAEEACVFETDTPEEGKSLWICSHYDAKNTEITYIKHIIGKTIIKWDMIVRDKESGSTIDMVCNMTSLSKEGVEFTKQMDAGLKTLFNSIETQINDYITQ